MRAFRDYCLRSFFIDIDEIVCVPRAIDNLQFPTFFGLVCENLYSLNNHSIE